ncbi:S-adenosyl-L-methionine-dependent methyltransferase [Leptodontidium sp. MPI-SDFR-AT-0119]|nr:S-adenosyl-L-methionine-dependent methyltransferase [Leptodontidium sp. MPI-SDFR-AT-0119]
MDPPMDYLASETPTHGSALHWEDEACEILQDSTTAKDILLVCSYFPFPDPDIPLAILSRRRIENSLTDVDILGLCKAEETLRRVVTECNSCSWNQQWSPPFASSAMGPTRAANDTDKDLFTFASRVTFMALERKACGLSSRAVEDIFDGLTQGRLLLEYRFNELGISKEEYEKVEKLKNPLARWIFSTGLRSTGGSPCASDAFAPILHPIKELFENRELPLMSVLQRLKVLDILHQDILDGLDPRWDGLSEEDFCFLEDVTNHKPRELAGLLIEKDLSCSQKFYPNDFLRPAELRSKSPQWSSLIHTVRVCAKAHPDLGRRIDEAAKILLYHGNFFSGMALVYGLCEANHPPAKPWWNRMAYRVSGWLLGLPQRIEDDAGNKPTGAENKSARSCMGDLLGTLVGMQQNMAGRPHTSGTPPVNNPGHADDHDHAETAIGPDAYVDSDLDSAVELDRSSTTTLSSAVFESDERYGRGYRKGKYLLPNDEQEQKRLDLQDDLFSLTLSGRLHLVRLPATYRALDICTGTGIWSVNFANEHPDVGVYGVDLSSIQPTWCACSLLLFSNKLIVFRIPRNCMFQIYDLSLPWTFEFLFDFIHGRMLFCSFSDPLHVFREAFKALTAGGVIEMQDLIFEFRSFDGSLEGSTLETWAKKVKEAFGSKGIDLTSASRYRNYLEAVGFEDIQQQEFFWPVGTWPNNQDFKTLDTWSNDQVKTLGSLCRANILDMLFAISIVPLTEHQPEHQQHSMSEEEVQLLLARVQEDLLDPKIHAYLQIVVVHGRKPRPNMFLAL